VWDAMGSDATAIRRPIAASQGSSHRGVTRACIDEWGGRNPWVAMDQGRDQRRTGAISDIPLGDGEVGQPRRGHLRNTFAVSRFFLMTDR
jgi:hypothetical protein